MGSVAPHTCAAGPPGRDRLTLARSAGTSTAGARRHARLRPPGLFRSRDPVAQGDARVACGTGRDPRLTALVATGPSAGMPSDAELAFRVSSSTTRSLTGRCKHGSRTRDPRISSPLLYPPELACCRSTRRHRAVHALPNPSVEPRASRDFEPGPLPRRRHGRSPYDRTRLGRLRPNSCSDVQSPETTRPRWAVPTGASQEDLPGALHERAGPAERWG